MKGLLASRTGATARPVCRIGPRVGVPGQHGIADCQGTTNHDQGVLGCEMVPHPAGDAGVSSTHSRLFQLSHEGVGRRPCLGSSGRDDRSDRDRRRGIRAAGRLPEPIGARRIDRIPWDTRLRHRLRTRAVHTETEALAVAKANGLITDRFQAVERATR